MPIKASYWVFSPHWRVVFLFLVLYPLLPSPPPPACPPKNPPTHTHTYHSHTHRLGCRWLLRGRHGTMCTAKGSDVRPVGFEASLCCSAVAMAAVVFSRMFPSCCRGASFHVSPTLIRHTLHFTLHTVHFTLFTPYSTLYTLHFTLHTLHSTLYTPHSTLDTIPFTLYTLHSTLHTLHFCTPHFTLFTPHSTLYTPHSTLYTPHSTLSSPHCRLVTGEFAQDCSNKLLQKSVLRDCISMCFHICTMNMRVSIRVCGLHLVL